MTVSDSSRLDALVERLRVAIQQKHAVAAEVTQRWLESNALDERSHAADAEEREARKALEHFLASANEPGRLEVR
jgi:hypothetical protein